MTDKRITRRTLYIGDDLNAMLDNGRVAGASASERINRLAARYAAMVKELVPQRWSASDWAIVVKALGDVTINKPFDAMVLSVRLKQMSKQKLVGSDISALAYRVDNLSLQEALAVVDVAERILAAGVTQPEALAEWLHTNGVTAV